MVGRGILSRPSDSSMVLFFMIKRHRGAKDEIIIYRLFLFFPGFSNVIHLKAVKVWVPHKDPGYRVKSFLSVINELISLWSLSGDILIHRDSRLKPMEREREGIFILLLCDPDRRMSYLVCISLIIRLGY